MRTILISLFILLASYGCTHGKYSYLDPENKKHHAIIKIQPVDGNGSCTAFVVSDTMAITAAHCVIEIVGFGARLNSSGFKITNSFGKDTKIVAYVSRKHVDTRMDSAVITGNFSRFNKMPVSISKTFLNKGAHLVHCGYAKGNFPPVCTEGKLIGTDLFQVKSTAFLVPGMSGGPVINSDGIAVGINSAVTRDSSLYCPTFGMLQLITGKK